ncbi:MAG: hypothetical protein ABI761_00595 [Saprospiraceae bacterium]
MSKSYKTTGCFRFVVFMVILAPIVYLAASYYNGQDGIQNIRNYINKAKNTVGISDKVKPNNPIENKSTEKSEPEIAQDDKITDLKVQVSLKDKEINALIQQNLDLKQKLKECEEKPVKEKPIK